MLPARPEALRFGGYTLDLARCALLRGTQPIALRPRAFETLRLLAENPYRLVTKAEFFETLWPGLCVTDDSLVQCIGEVRRALGEDGRGLIRTVPRRGYLFAAEVVPRAAPEPVPDAPPRISAAGGARVWRALGLLVPLLLLAWLAGGLLQVPAEDRAIPSPPAAAPGRRVALVIGNAAYPGEPAPLNARRDATAVATALQRAGFAQVTLLHDPPRDALLAAIAAFARQAEEADWAVAYYAGRGIEAAGAPYLVPVDAVAPELAPPGQVVALDALLRGAAPARRLRLVIFDACRIGPDSEAGVSPVPSLGRGAGTAWPAGGATLVAFSTDQGETAADGDAGGNGPYAEALVAALDTPGLEIALAFRVVRDRVVQATGQRQQPFLYGSLPAEPLYFRSP
ncbi:caspase family protein [Paracraurococcus lichenis]|uniref:Caspase family protein n=1 Tax=Paracraurococcus lichenis TaxID=3064888 RepID=A0ABT9DW18_9PROT|nr:caspase family protein [Paracraurococcus sp. LOR1-02]MDO9708063.1 caspase family protein [Paracraurococcus sp. LOR1-02]